MKNDFVNLRPPYNTWGFFMSEAQPVPKSLSSRERPNLSKARIKIPLREAQNMAEGQIGAVGESLLELFVLSACESCVINSLPKDIDVDKTLADIGSLDKCLDDMTNRGVLVCQWSEESGFGTVMVPQSEVVSPSDARFLYLLGLWGLINTTYLEGQINDEESFRLAKDNILTLLNRDNPGFSPAQVAKILDSPVLLDTSGVPLENSEGQPINSIRDWMHSWLKEVDEKRGNRVKGLWNTFREHLTDSEFAQAVAEIGLCALNLLPPGDSIETSNSPLLDDASPEERLLDLQEDDLFQRMRVDACREFLGQLTKPLTIGEVMGMFLWVMDGSEKGYGQKDRSAVDDIMSCVDRLIEENG